MSYIILDELGKILSKSALLCTAHNTTTATTTGNNVKKNKSGSKIVIHRRFDRTQLNKRKIQTMGRKFFIRSFDPIKN